MSSNATQKTVLFAAIALFLVWAATNMQRFASDDDALIRVVLVSIFAVLILARPKPEREKEEISPNRFRLPRLHGSALSLVVGAGGALLSVVGIIFTVHQFEWLGLVLLLYACLRWALPRSHRRDLILALFLLYWMHPIPAQVFGRFQLWMQLLSVQGAEALLHTINVPVWAEGFYLRTGLLTLGIPEACSGMRTVVTVSLCTLGVGVLLRLRWYESVVLLFAGVVQVLLFNILRIAAVVIIAPRMSPEWSQTVLHDTLGFFLLVTIMAVQLEVSAWKVFRDKRRRTKAGIAAGELERPDRGRPLPGAWRLFVSVWKPVVALGIVALGCAFVVVQQRPGHRLAMMRPVIDMLLENDVEAADAAIVEALKLVPSDRELLTKRAHVLLVKKDYHATLALIAALPPPLSIVEVVIQSRALMSLGQVDEAYQVISELAAVAGNRPGVAMIMAEYAAVKGRPDDVNRSIVFAARSHLVQGRVRALFPYLATHEQWKTIVSCDDRNVPYEDVGSALVAVQAHLHRRDLARAAEIMEEAIKADPNDPRFLHTLFLLTLNTRGGRWEDLFAANLQQNIGKLTADQLAAYMDYAFQLSRPDLAWQAWHYLQQRDATDPALYLSLVRFHNAWFGFRRHALSVKAESREQQIDLSVFCRATRDLRPFSAFWRLVPQVAELAATPGREGRERYLKLFFAEIDKRVQSGTLTQRMELSVAPALGLVGRYEEAHAKLSELEAKYPDKKRDILYQRARFYHQQGRWEMLYEAMVAYRALPNYQPQLESDLMLINAMMNVNMGLAAMHVATQARQLYPGTPRVQVALAAIWDVFRYKDQALFALTRAEKPDPRALAQLLYDTGRFKEADRMSSALGVGIVRNALGEKQALMPPRAEWVLAKRWPEPLDAAGFEKEVAEYEGNIAVSTSPYIVALRSLARDWCRARGEGNVSDVAAWAAVGRDELEKAGALHQLTMLLARQKRYEEATTVIQAALGLLPDSAVLRRVHIVLAADVEAAVAAARASCPDDPAIWLAAIVTRFKRDGAGVWAEEMIKSAARERTFSAETFASAGDFLFRVRMPAAAALAARHAIEIGQGLLPPYVLGIRSGLVLGDKEWALSCALAGSEQARDPTPFFKTVVMLKWARETLDTDVIKALQYLQEHDTVNAEWSERLGQVYFEKRDSRRALSLLSPLINQDPSRLRVRSLLVAAEAARAERNHAKAVEILEVAYRFYPDRINVLNNLIYTLLDNPATAARAKTLLPALLQMGDDSFAVLDTVAIVHLRNGDLDEARRYIERAIALLEPDHYAALEVTLNAAEICLLSGEYDRAERYLAAAGKFAERPAASDERAKALRQKLQEVRAQ